jgi:hypothetical protein
MKCAGDSVWCTAGEVSGVQCILCPLCVDLNLHSSLSARSQLALSTLSARSHLALSSLSLLTSISTARSQLALSSLSLLTTWPIHMAFTMARSFSFNTPLERGALLHAQ